MTSSLESILSSYGLIIRGPLVIDGTLARCGTARKPRSNNGWYVIYDEGKAAIFGNWENGDNYEYWRTDDKNYQPSPVSMARIEELKNSRAREQESLSHAAVEYIEQEGKKKGYSEYLVRKKLLDIRKLSKGVRFEDGTNALIIPIQDSTGKVWSYQKIYPDGSKYFMQGGRVKGCYFQFGAPDPEAPSRVILCEGFATGASIYVATQLPVIVAFNASNIKPVADSLPFHDILIAADNDESAVGEQYASATGYPYILPPVVGWDFSDMFIERGKEAIRELLAPQPIDTMSDTIVIPPIHGLVGEIAEWITATAIRPQPILSLAAALAFVGMLKGHRIRGYTDLRTNLLLMALAPTAAGKEHPQNCIKRLAALTGNEEKMLGEPVSGGGFLTGLNMAGRVGLLVMDEIGRYLSNLSNKNAGAHQREIIDYIIKTFSCANSVLKGRQHVDNKKNPRIDVNQPHFCCFGSTVKERFQKACGSSEIVDGFLNRWLLFATDERPARQPKVRTSDAPPKVLIDKISNLGVPVYGKYPPHDPDLHEVRFTVEAWEFFCKYRQKMDLVIDTAKYPANQLYSRTCEHVEKIALTLCDNEDILIKDVEVAIAIVEQSNAAILRFAGLIADNIYEQDYIRVRELIRTMREVRRSELSRHTQFIQGGKSRRAEIMEILIDENLVVAQKNILGGKLMMYKWIGG